MINIRTGALLALGAVWTLAAVLCTPPARSPRSKFRNLSDTAFYVGMEACRTCHASIYESFKQTGMGQSLRPATRAHSDAVFSPHAVVYDSMRNFWYRPLWKADTLFIHEYRIQHGDTVYSRVEKIDYIIGSGHHTNSHLWLHNGYLYQAPLTFYTQRGIWDLPPGFSNGANSRWQRIIDAECITCHNMFPRQLPAAPNKFVTIPTGIECERCHGPGSIHVQEKRRGLLVDTSRQPDYSIVNPARLPRDLQIDVCQRCHLQGITVLKEGMSFYDFKPGMRLSDIMHVFMPRYEGDPPKFIMASHADRMKQSRCYQQSQMTCLTCHNPHHSVLRTPPDHFDRACLSCHQGKAGCTRSLHAESAAQPCYGCHMPVSATIDIPHVTVHDHRIQIPLSQPQKEALWKFTHLECLTDPKPDPLSVAQGYLQAYEAFAQQPYLLDSAARYLNLVRKKNRSYDEAMIRLAFLRQRYEEVIALADRLSTGPAQSWTWYRIGEAFLQAAKPNRARTYFEKALQTDSLNLDFLNKYAASLVQLKEHQAAKKVYQRIVGLNDRYAPALTNLGYLYLLEGDVLNARPLLDAALQADPDYEQGLMNRAALAAAEKKWKESAEWLQRVLALNPDNKEAHRSLQWIRQQ